MTSVDHGALLSAYAELITRHDWARLGEYYHSDAIVEYPQSGERFAGLANIRGQFEDYPGLEPGSTEFSDVVGGTKYALTPMYTLITVDGSGDRGTAIFRTRYPDGSLWWVLNVYELRDALISRCRVFFAPDFDAPDWRAPFHEDGGT